LGGGGRRRLYYIIIQKDRSVFRISQMIQVKRQLEVGGKTGNRVEGGVTGLTARRRGHHDQMVKLPFSIFYQLVRLLFRSLEGELEASCCIGHSNTKIQQIRSAPSIQYIS
jgi:hypothetical protein